MKAGIDPKLEQQGITLLGVALVLVLLFHGVLLFRQSFINTYDALIHIFFAAHYAESWFDPWEPRWYTGFMTVAYPPLSHYLVALSSKLIGLKMGFACHACFNSAMASSTEGRLSSMICWLK